MSSRITNNLLNSQSFFFHATSSASSRKVIVESRKVIVESSNKSFINGKIDKHSYEMAERKELRTLLEYARNNPINVAIQNEADKTDLHLAILNNEGERKIQDLIRAAKDPIQYMLTKDKDGKIPTHYLYNFQESAFSKLSVFLIEIKRNSKTDEVQKNIQKFLKIQDNNGRNLLHLSAMSGDVGAIKIILDQFDDLDEMRDYMKTVDKYGKTFIHYLVDLSLEVLHFVNIKEIKLILKTLSDKVGKDTLVEIFNIKDNNNKTALYYSFFNENCIAFGLDLLKMFNKTQRKDLLNVKIEEGENLAYEELDKKRALLSEEIDYKKDLLGEEIDYKKDLLNSRIEEEEDKNYYIEDRKNLLQEELDKRKDLLQEELDRRKEILSEELSYRKDRLNKKIIDGKTLFQHLLMHIDEDLVLQIFDSLDRSDLLSLINTLDYEKKSPLHLAAIAKNARVFEAILNLFDDDDERKEYIKQKDVYSKTALHYVSKVSDLSETETIIVSAVTRSKILFDPLKRFRYIVQLIQKNLKDEFSDFIKEKDIYGKTTLYYALEDSRYLLLVLFRIDQDKIANCLMACKIDDFGNNLLHFLVMFSQFSAILTILKYCPIYEIFSLLISINNKEKSVLDFLKDSNIPRIYSNELLKLIKDPFERQIVGTELGIF